MHVVIPAAGEGRRFAEAGYTQPKPLIDVLGKPMLQQVIENIRPFGDYRVTVVSQVPLPGIGARVVLTEPTGGAVETILKAGIGEGPLLIANCDQLVALDMYLFAVGHSGDGAVATFRSSKPHHSYVKTDSGGWINRIAEKTVISDRAVAGVYYFADGAMFRSAAERIVRAGERVRGEFYVSTVIAHLVEQGAKLTAWDTDVAVLGTPEELQLFLMAARVAAAL